MCGICGLVGERDVAAAESSVRCMMSAMPHRGPDDEGLLLTPGAVLGMRRLSIIDLAGGRQPITSEDGAVAVVLNGEIYNFRELRRSLEASGHVFRTRSDTEVIVHAFEQWGEGCLARLRGMFAFALLDRRPGRTPSLLLARDRLGIKPLYYARTGKALYFASEVRALLAADAVPPLLSRAALESYLLFGSVGEPLSLVECVLSLPPGHFLRIPLAADASALASMVPESYWKPVVRVSSESIDARQAGIRVRTALEDAVRSHLVADVPLGVFLSSGLDSTAIAALAAREHVGIHTFTVVFPEQEFSEGALARQTAERIGADHRELLVGGEEMLAHLDDAVAAFDQPSMDGINTWFVSAAARRAGLKVALSGLGGDEVFGGYRTFRTAPKAERLARLAQFFPRSARGATSGSFEAVATPLVGADPARKLAAVWRDPGALPAAFFFTRTLFPPEQCETLLGGACSAESAAWRDWLRAAAADAASLDGFARTSLLELRSYLVNTLLRDTDAMSMNHSLEVRVPFLDHALVEAVAALPEPLRRGRRPKALLVSALADLLPPELVAQPKRTFTLPWERWLAGPLRARVEASLAELSPALSPALNAPAVRAVWKEFLAGRTTWSRPWSLYVLNEWARRNLEAKGRMAHVPAAAGAMPAF